jgi:hypothetical protein
VTPLAHSLCFVFTLTSTSLLPFPVLLRILSYVYLLQSSVCVCSRHLLITIFSACFFFVSSLIDPRPCVFPRHTLFSLHVVSRSFFHFRVPYPVFLTDGLLKIDYYRLSFHLLADFCYSRLTSLFAPSPLTHTHISLVSLRLLLLLMLLLRRCQPPLLTVPSSPVKKRTL